jgi:hypothetical protein
MVAEMQARLALQPTCSTGVALQPTSLQTKNLCTLAPSPFLLLPLVVSPIALRSHPRLPPCRRRSAPTTSRRWRPSALTPRSSLRFPLRVPYRTNECPAASRFTHSLPFRFPTAPCILLQPLSIARSCDCLGALRAAVGAAGARAATGRTADARVRCRRARRDCRRRWQRPWRVPKRRSAPRRRPRPRARRCKRSWSGRARRTRRAPRPRRGGHSGGGGADLCAAAGLGAGGGCCNFSR